MNVESLVRARGGLMHRSTLRDLGVSPYRVRKEIEAGRLTRVGRHRVAVAGCAPALLRAVKLGGKLTCVSAAVHRGLWAYDDERLHVAVPDTFSTWPSAHGSATVSSRSLSEGATPASSSRSGLSSGSGRGSPGASPVSVLNPAQAAVLIPMQASAVVFGDVFEPVASEQPADSAPADFASTPLLHWGRGPAPVHLTDTVEPMANMLVHIARCQPLELAVAIFDSALNKRMLDMAELRRLARALGGRFKAVVEACDAGADSGIESLIRIRAGRRGIVMRIQVLIDGHRVDGLIGERLVVQADGFGPHSSSPQRSKDLREDARLVLRGYTVLRFSYAQILYDWPHVEEQILAAMAQRLHLWER